MSSRNDAIRNVPGASLITGSLVVSEGVAMSVALAGPPAAATTDAPWANLSSAATWAAAALPPLPSDLVAGLPNATVGAGGVIVPHAPSLLHGRFVWDNDALVRIVVSAPASRAVTALEGSNVTISVRPSVWPYAPPPYGPTTLRLDATVAGASATRLAPAYPASLIFNAWDFETPRNITVRVLDDGIVNSLSAPGFTLPVNVRGVIR